jgi:hypothetical protein
LKDNSKVHFFEKASKISRYPEVLFVSQLLVHGLQLSAGVVRVIRQFLVHGVDQRFVGHLANRQTGLVHDGDHTLMGLLDQIANYLEGD